MKSMAIHVRAMLDFKRRGSIVFDYGNNLRAQAFEEGVKDAFDFPALCRPSSVPSSARARGLSLGRPFRRPGGHLQDRRSGPAGISGERIPSAMDETGPGEGKIPGAARPYLLAGVRERARNRKVFNDMVASGKLQAPIVIGRDHLDAGSVASPYRETEE